MKQALKLLAAAETASRLGAKVVWEMEGVNDSNLATQLDPLVAEIAHSILLEFDNGTYRGAKMTSSLFSALIAQGVVTGLAAILRKAQEMEDAVETKPGVEAPKAGG